MKAQLKDLIDKSVDEFSGKAGIEIPASFDYDLAPPKDPSHGDFACNAAFKIAKVIKTNPRKLAEDFLEVLNQFKPDFVTSAEIAGPGFLNFTLKKTALGSVLKQIYEADQDYGKSDFGAGKKVLLEYVSANPTGPLTIAHGRQAAIGDCLTRILRASGHEVCAEYYLNDGGRQIKMLGTSVWVRYGELCGHHHEFPEEGYQGEYIKGIAQSIFDDKGDELLSHTDGEEIAYCSKVAKNEIMSWIKKDLENMRVEFDSFFSEQTLYGDESVEKTLKVLDKEGYIFEEEGAVWFRSTDFGDDKDRVVKKSTGDYTYLAPDIAYHHRKYQRGFNLLVNLWGPDHHGYIPRLKAACQALGNESEQIHVGIVQLTTLYKKGEPVRMSTRAGEFITLKELYDEVGVDATRFFFVMRRQESHLDFDLDLAKEKSQDNPVFYLQYAHARIASLIDFSEKEIDPDVNLDRLNSLEEAELIGMLSEFPEQIKQASKLLEPYRLVDYLRNLAACFHKFYGKCRVVSDDEELTYARLLLCQGVRVVMRNGLGLLGITAPDRM